MGLLCYVVCRRCKVYRPLDKFYTMFEDVPDRQAALEFRKEVERDSFRAGLLVSFMWKHREHNCFVCDENMEFVLDAFDEEDVDYWGKKMRPRLKATRGKKRTCREGSNK